LKCGTGTRCDKKMPELSTASKKPIKLIGWNWWDSPKGNLIPDLARGDYPDRSGNLLRDPT
jgi:hypothetical protein